MKRLNPVSDASINQTAIDLGDAEKASVWALLQEFAALKNALEDAETALAPVKAAMLKTVTAMGGRLEMGGYTVTVVDVERDVFNLKAAREKLDGRILKPFITKSKYPAIRLTRKI